MVHEADCLETFLILPGRKTSGLYGIGFYLGSLSSSLTTVQLPGTSVLVPNEQTYWECTCAMPVGLPSR